MTTHGLPDRASAFPAAFHLAVVMTAPVFLALRCMEALRCVEESSLALRWVDGPLPIDEHGRRTPGPARLLQVFRWREAPIWRVLIPWE